MSYVICPLLITDHASGLILFFQFDQFLEPDIQSQYPNNIFRVIPDRPGDCYTQRTRIPGSVEVSNVHLAVTQRTDKPGAIRKVVFCANALIFCFVLWMHYDPCYHLSIQIRQIDPLYEGVLIDYFLHYGLKFRLRQFVGGGFLKSGKIYLFFHSWELLSVILILGLIFKSVYLLLITSGMSLHMLVDQFQKRNPLFYFLFYRVKKRFDIRELEPGYLEEFIYQ